MASWANTSVWAGGCPFQRGGRVCAAPLRRGDAVAWLAVTRKAQMRGYALVASSQGAVRARHDRRLCLSALLFRDGTLYDRHRLPDLIFDIPRRCAGRPSRSGNEVQWTRSRPTPALAGSRRC